MNCSRHHKTYRKSAGEQLALRSQWSSRPRYFIYWWSDKYSNNMRPRSKCLVSGTDIHFCRSGLLTWICQRINWSACLKCRFLTQKFWVSCLRWNPDTCLFVCFNQHFNDCSARQGETDWGCCGQTELHEGSNKSYRILLCMGMSKKVSGVSEENVIEIPRPYAWQFIFQDSASSRWDTCNGMEWISLLRVFFWLGWSGELAEVGGFAHCNSLWIKWYEIGLESIRRKEEIALQKPFKEH